MVTRIDTTAEQEVTGLWSPTNDEVFLQLEFDSDTASPQVLVQMAVSPESTSYPVVAVLTKSRPVVRLAKVPFIMLAASGNEAGAHLRVLDNEG